MKIAANKMMDREPRFDGEVTIYRSDASLWSIMRKECFDFDCQTPKAPVMRENDSSAP
ncbi:MAG: hypothetical protein KKB02_02780 [Alphaproteobacteria bacterium]|nr:hypothetical protein [Alphaproteobacteria bacterium]